jgi:hypothetical protein
MSTVVLLLYVMTDALKPKKNSCEVASLVPSLTTALQPTPEKQLTKKNATIMEHYIEGEEVAAHKPSTTVTGDKQATSGKNASKKLSKKVKAGVNAKIDVSAEGGASRKMAGGKAGVSVKAGINVKTGVSKKVSMSVSTKAHNISFVFLNCTNTLIFKISTTSHTTSTTSAAKSDKSISTSKCSTQCCAWSVTSHLATDE